MNSLRLYVAGFALVCLCVAESPNCVQPNTGLTSGCTIPTEDFLFKEKFTPACYRHNICYNCAARFNMSKKDCDKLFLAEMQRTCEKEALCLSFALVYYSGARAGDKKFVDTPPSECNPSWVSSCFT